ncbi:MAG: TauD/TfdA family dioxygenase [Halofilum sp. (in: g-proteobacteria)]|nr:TauD/TfdA family dioxygenase [Halofilum sp. (in: g-proteobacteria)]
MVETATRSEVSGGRLVLALDDGNSHTLHPLWLRERCPCPECRDPKTGQRLLDAWSLPLDTAVAHVDEADGAVRVTFADGHVAPFARAELEAALRPGADERDDIVTWDAGLDPIPEADWARAADDDAALYELLEQLRRHAFVVVRNVPADMDGVGAVVERIGPMRRTNWGGIADVKAIPDAYDLTMTTRALEPHTDNPYREPVPGYIFLHCLVNDAEGGDSTITDGFRVAEELRRNAPEELDALTRVRPDFTYVDDDTILENSGPLIELDPRGRVRQLRMSNRTDAVAPGDPALLDTYYRARRRLTDLVNDPAYQLRFKLGPGDLLIMDNYRLLHGRTGYRPGTGHRHMRQCYMDRDSVGSRRKVLARRFG